MRRARVVAIAAAAAMAGCSLDPVYHRPAALMPDHWPTGPAYPAPTERSRLPPWREVILDPALRSVIDQALNGNRDLQLAIERVREAHAQKDAANAARQPAVDVGMEATYLHEPISAVLGGSASGAVNEHVYALGPTISNVDLDLFGKAASASRARREAFFATEEARRGVQILLIKEVASAWLAIAADRDLMRLDRERLENRRAALAVARARVRAGLAPARAEDAAEIALGAATSAAARSLAAEAIDVNLLTRLVGGEVHSQDLPAGLAEGHQVADVPLGLSSSVLLDRPDVMQAEHLLKAANADIGAARAAMFPSIALTGSGGVTSSALQTLVRSGSGAWSLIPSLTSPLWDGGRNAANLRAAKSEARAAVSAYEKALQAAFQEAADALARREAAGRQLEVGRRDLQLQATAERRVSLRYAKGAGSYEETLEGRHAGLGAGEDLVRERLDYARAQLLVYLALGGGGEA
jgi:multidrug efflux system outer membrane protein